MEKLVDSIYRFALRLLYQVIIVPSGWWARKTKDPFDAKRSTVANPSESLWLERGPSDTKLHQARKQY